MSHPIEISSTPIERDPLQATLYAKIDSLNNRRGQFKLTLIGESRDLEQLVEAARMQVSDLIEVRLTEQFSK